MNSCTDKEFYGIFPNFSTPYLFFASASDLQLSAFCFQTFSFLFSAFGHQLPASDHRLSLLFLSKVTAEE